MIAQLSAQRVEVAAQALDRLLGRWEKALWVVFSAGWIAACVYLASVRPLWFDEIFTLYEGRAESLQDLWSALTTAGDFNPPLLPVLVGALERVGLEPQLASRLPSTLAYLGMMLFLYLWISRATSPVFGWIAVLFSGRLVHYAVEGRSYALMLGLFAALCWLWWRRADARARNGELVALSLCVALGVSAHFHFLFAGTTIAVAEGIRTARGRRADVRLWAAAALGLVPLLFYWPIFGYFREFSAAGYWSTAHPVSLGDTYSFLVREVGTVWLALGVLGAVHALRPLWFPRLTRRDGVRAATTLAVSVAALPILGVAVSAWTGGLFLPRHVLPTLIGIGACMALATWRLGHGSRAAAFLMTVVIAWSLVGEGRTENRRGWRQREDLEATRAWLVEHADRGSVRTCNPLLALAIAQAAAQDGDPSPVTFCKKPDRRYSSDRSLWALGERAPLAMATLEECTKDESGLFLLESRPQHDCFADGGGPELRKVKGRGRMGLYGRRSRPRSR